MSAQEAATWEHLATSLRATANELKTTAEGLQALLEQTAEEEHALHTGTTMARLPTTVTPGSLWPWPFEQPAHSQGQPQQWPPVPTAGTALSPRTASPTPAPYGGPPVLVSIGDGDKGDGTGVDGNGFNGNGVNGIGHNV